MAVLDIARRAIVDAKQWLSIAEKSIEVEAYSKAIYAMEMGVEVSLKSLLLANGVDFPKTHNIIPYIKELVSSDQFKDLEIRNNLDQLLSTFHALLDLRTASGYSYESSLDSAFFKERAEKYLAPSHEIVTLIEKLMKL